MRHGYNEYPRATSGSCHLRPELEGHCEVLSLRSHDRAPYGAFVMLERRAVKVACVVLRGLGEGDLAWLPGDRLNWKYSYVFSLNPSNNTTRPFCLLSSSCCITDIGFCWRGLLNYSRLGCNWLQVRDQIWRNAGTSRL